MALTFLFADELTANHLHALSNCVGVRTSAAGTTTSASYVNMPGTPQVSFTKVDAASKVRIDFHASLYTTAYPTHVQFGVNIGGSDTLIAELEMNIQDFHHQVSGVNLISGLAAGTYTVQGRWRRGAGPGTLTTTTDDQTSFAVSEVQG